MLIFPNRLFQYFNWLFFFCTFFITFSSLSTTIVKHKRRIIQQLTPLSKKASINGQRLFEKIAKNELQEHIDDLYMQLFHWAKNEGINFVKIFEEKLEKTEKDAYEKREELSNDIDQLPALVIDAIQIVDLFRQDPTRSTIEEKKMINDLKKTIEPLFVNRYQIMLDRTRKLQEEYGVSLFRSPFAKRRKRYFKSEL